MFILNECLKKLNGLRDIDEFIVLTHLRNTPTKFTITCLSKFTYRLKIKQLKIFEKSKFESLLSLKTTAVPTNLKHSLFDIILKLYVSRN